MIPSKLCKLSIQVVDELQSYDTSIRPWSDDSVWAFDRRKRSVWLPWSPGGQDAYSIFNVGFLAFLV